jgi:hypothetical protein
MVSERPADDNSRRYIEYAFGGNDALALAEAKVFAALSQGRMLPEAGLSVLGTNAQFNLLF